MSHNIIFITFIIILICCLYMLLYKNNEKFYNVNNKDTILLSSINNGYNMLNQKRFNIIDNQMRLDNINQRINKILTQLQTNSPQRNISNPIIFY